MLKLCGFKYREATTITNLLYSHLLFIVNDVFAKHIQMCSLSVNVKNVPNGKYRSVPCLPITKGNNKS